MLFKNVNARELELDERELERRLSSGGRVEYKDDNRYLRLASAASCAYLAQRLPISRRDGEMLIGDIPVVSKALAKVARGCSECFVMVCTLGMGVDRLIAREQYTSVSDAFVIDAMADAMIESLCDAAERDITTGLVTVPRFSPGYADLPLNVGRNIVRLLCADTRLGISFSESGLMIPRKSVSAIVCIRD